MRPAHWISLLRLMVLVALAASAALYVDYTSPAAAFCTAGSSCAKVRASGFGYIAGGLIPVPLVGLLGYGTVLIVSLLPAARRRLLVPLAYVGGAAAVLFLFLQALVIGEFCSLCLITDISALVVAGAAFGHQRALAKGEPDGELVRPWAWALLGLLAVVAPLAWPAVRPEPPVPPRVRELYVPNKINVVEFADFECPFCRALHPQLKKIIADYPGQVNFIRLNMPLASHRHARNAARAEVCAADQKRGDPMADALFETEDLSPASIRRIAVGLGLDMDEFDSCVGGGAVDQRIDGQAQILRNAGFQGLPTTFVGNQRIVGAQPEEVFRDAFERASRKQESTSVPGSLYLSAVGLLAALVLGFGWVRRPKTSARPSPP